MRRWLLSVGAALAFAAIALGARAGLENIEFPVVALGNCESKDACFAYCEAPPHQAACFEFARVNGLMDEEDIAVARQVEYGGGGPGGCESEDECHAFCDDPANAESCLDFASEHKLVAPEKEEVVRELIAGNGPGGCRTEEECRTYCEDPSHIEECLAFADEHGLIDEKGAKVAQLVASEGGPGGCFNEESCRAYCDESEHLEECIAFATEHDLMSAEEATRALAAGGTGPGSCRGEECKAYCEDPEHGAECVEFAKERGFISEEDAALALTIAAEGGPGSCHNETECHAYCETEGHEQECFDFGVAHGLISEEKAERVQKMINKDGPGGCRGRACEAYCSDPEHGEECLQFAVENDLIPPEEVARARKGMAALKQGGPGGCRGHKECDSYCREPDHEEECFSFAVEHDLISKEERERAQEFKAREGEIVKIVEEQGGPGGCRSKRECMAYCGDTAHEEECGSFAEAHGFAAPPSMRRGEEQGGPGKYSFEGPGGCRSPAECARYCANPENREACEAMKRKMGPPRGEENIEHPDESFEAEFSGPGGCASPRECFEYCKAHEDECQSFGGKEENSRPAPCPLMPDLECPEGTRKVYHREGRCPVAECRAVDSEEARPDEERGEQSFGRPRRGEPPQFEDASFEFEGPGGCKTPQECASFCSNNPSECGVGGSESGEAGEFGEIPPRSMPREFVSEEEPHEGFTPPEGFDRRLPSPTFTGEEQRGEFRPPEEFQQPEGGFQPPEGFHPPGGNFQPLQGDFVPQGNFTPPAEFSSPRDDGGERGTTSVEAQFFSANSISCDSGLNCLSACLAVANMRECRQMVKWYLMAKL